MRGVEMRALETRKALWRRAGWLCTPIDPFPHILILRNLRQLGDGRAQHDELNSALRMDLRRYLPRARLLAIDTNYLIKQLDCTQTGRRAHGISSSSAAMRARFWPSMSRARRTPCLHCWPPFIQVNGTRRLAEHKPK